MANSYDESGLLRDYGKLSDEFKARASRYVKKLLQLQRAEQRITGQLHSYEWKQRQDGQEGIHCSFCGKHQYEAERIIAGPNEVYICDSCARLCGSILDEVEAEKGEELPQ